MAKIFNLLRGRRARLERDLERELRYHVERRVADKTAEGLSKAEARRQVALEFGGVAQVQEDVRDTWIWRWLADLRVDTRHALRSLAKSWGFTLGAGSVLALGIGANTAIFSIVNTVLLRPLDYPDADRIVSIRTLSTSSGEAKEEAAGPDFIAWQARNSAFEFMAHCSGEDDIATVVDGRAEFANAQFVSPDFFAVFGRPASAGRLLSRADAAAPGAPAPPAIAVLRHSWAMSHFGSAQAALGKTITLYDRKLEVVGVAAPGFRYPGSTDVWTPDAATESENRDGSRYLVVGRLKPSVAFADAEVQMRAIGDSLASQYQENRFRTVALASLQASLTGHVQSTLWILMAAVLVVLIIACANIANLQLARSTNATREIALRAALGAGRSRVVRQLLTESAVLAGLGGIMGVTIAAFLVEGLAAISPANLPRIDELEIDGHVLAFALALSFASTLLFGLLPALNLSRVDLSKALKLGGSRGPIGGGGRLRSTLVVVEVALSVMLLAAAGLLLRSFYSLNQVNLGFTTERVVVAYTQYVATTADARTRCIAFYKDVLARLRAVPGVTAVSGAAFLPMGREWQPAYRYLIEGRPEVPLNQRPAAEFQAIVPHYFETLQIPIAKGRDFDEHDIVGRPLVAIVNERLARTEFPNESPLGRRIRYGNQWLEIVGIAADTRWRNPSQPPLPELYVASRQGFGGSLSILVRTSADQTLAANTIRTLFARANPDVPIRVETMRDLFDHALAHPRFRTELIGAFAGLAALLAAVGIFSVLAFLVGQRTRELAVRRAIGAQAGDVIRLIVVYGLRLAAAGLVLGLAGASAVARLLEGLLFEISPWDAATYLVTAIILGGTAMVATLLPAIRAATVDPLIALRHD